SGTGERDEGSGPSYFVHTLSGDCCLLFSGDSESAEHRTFERGAVDPDGNNTATFRDAHLPCLEALADGSADPFADAKTEPWCDRDARDLRFGQRPDRAGRHLHRVGATALG